MPLGLIARQLDVAVSFAEASVFPRISPATAHFAAVVGSTCDVRPDPETGHWVADWPDGDEGPAPVPTPAWLLWHITWWWSSAEQWAAGGTGEPPSAWRWYDAEIGIERIRGLARHWHRVIATGEADRATAAPFAAGQTLGGLAAWVNFELVKNLSELSLLLTQAEHH